MIRVIICADGEGKRWKDPVTPKHLVEVEGEILIHRTVRQLRERGVCDVWITAHDARYDVPGSTRYEPENNVYEIDKFLACRPIWNGPTRFFYGDVWYSDTCMNTMVGWDDSESFRIFGRRYGSKITGTRHGEPFGVAFTDHERVAAAAAHVRDLHATGQINRSGTWELYQALIGERPRPFEEQTVDGHWHEINDWTEDFDCIEELVEWKRRRQGRRRQRPRRQR